MDFAARDPYENYQLQINLTEFSSLLMEWWADLLICLRETDFVGQSTNILRVAHWTSFLHTYNILLKENFTTLRDKTKKYKRKGKREKDKEEK